MLFKLIKKFFCTNLNFRPMSSSQLHVSPEQLYSCFQKNPIENLRTLKFVPKNMSPTIPAEVYHNPDQQLKISKRMIALQNLEIGDSRFLINRLNNRLQASNVKSTPAKLFIKIRDNLQDFSKNVKNEFVKIDEKVKVMKAKFHNRPEPNFQNKDLSKKLPATDLGKSIYEVHKGHSSAGLKRSQIQEMNNIQTKSLALNWNYTKPREMSRLRRDLTSVDTPDDGRLYAHQLLEPFQLRGELMEIDQKPEQESARNEKSHVLGVIQKNAADADGVYFPRKIE